MRAGRCKDTAQSPATPRSRGRQKPRSSPVCRSSSARPRGRARCSANPAVGNLAASAARSSSVAGGGEADRQPVHPRIVADQQQAPGIAPALARDRDHPLGCGEVEPLVVAGPAAPRPAPRRPAARCGWPAARSSTAPGRARGPARAAGRPCGSPPSRRAAPDRARGPPTPGSSQRDLAWRRRSSSSILTSGSRNGLRAQPGCARAPTQRDRHDRSIMPRRAQGRPRETIGDERAVRRSCGSGARERGRPARAEARALHQSRAVLARLQRAGARRGQQRPLPAAGAAALPVDLGQQSRRVLHGPGLGPDGAGQAADPAGGPGRADAGRAAGGDQAARRRPDHGAAALLARAHRPAARAERDHARGRRADRRRSRLPAPALQRGGDRDPDARSPSTRPTRSRSSPTPASASPWSSTAAAASR